MLAARSTAVVMVACAAVHIVCAVQHWSPALSVLTIGVALTCLRCLPGLWMSARVADWVWVTLGSAAMLILHLIMLAQPAGSGHGHDSATAIGTVHLDPLTMLGLVLPIVGLALAWWALGAPRTRSLRVGVPLDDHRPDRGLHR